MFDRALAADDRRVRETRRAALRHQQLERAERRLTPDPRRGLRCVEQFLVGDDLVRARPALGAGEDHRPDRLCSVPPSGPAMPVIATATSAPEASSAPCAIAQAVATLTAPNVSTTSWQTLSSAILASFE